MNIPAPDNVPVMEKNIGTVERTVSALGGCYLLYDAYKNNRSIPEILAAGFMLFRGVSGYCPAGDAFHRIADGNDNNSNQKSQPSNINIHTRLIIKKPIDKVYNFWRNLENLPLFMSHLKKVTVINESTSEWEAKLPGGVSSVSWRSEIVGEEPNRYIGWRSLPDSTIHNVGKVEFKNAGELGTLVHITISYQAPLGAAGEGVAKLLNPVFENIVRKDLMSFKRYMETGTTDKISQETVKIYSY